MAEYKKRPYYYSKPIKAAGECNEGDWVYDDDAKLCYVTKNEEGHTILHSYAIEHWISDDSPVYPVTLSTKLIMDKMTELRERYHKNNIMNADFSRELEAGLFELMQVDEYEEGCQKKYDEIWTRLENRYQELLGHAKALGLAK